MGARPHLVLLPGLVCDAAVWQPQCAALAALAHCQVVDYGARSSLRAMAERVLATAPAQQFALAGHSMGGRVAMEVLRLAPGRVTHLALLDTGYQARAAGAAGEEEARKRQKLLDIACNQGVRAMATQWVQGMLDPPRLADIALVETIVSMFARKSADTFARQIRALLARPDATPVLAAVHIPTLVLCGRADSWSPLAQHEDIAALLPAHPAVRVVDQAGHMSTMEQPQAVSAALLEWLHPQLTGVASGVRAVLTPGAGTSTARG